MKTIAAPAQAFRSSLRDAFDVGLDRRVQFMLLMALALVAVAFGALTVVVGDVFPTRPIFYFALPVVVVVLGASLVLDARICFIGLIVLRAILDPICVRATFTGFGGLGGLFNLTIICLAAILLFKERKRISTDVTYTWIPFVVLMAIDVVRSPDFVQATRVWLTVLTYASVFYGAIVCTRSAYERDRALRWMLLSSIPVFVYAIASFVIVGPQHVVESGEGLSGRLSSPLPHPNILAFYVVVILGAWLIRARTSAVGPALTWSGIGWTLLLLMLLVMLAGTQTRAAWVGALVLFATYGLLVRQRYLLAMLLGATLAFLIPEVRERLLDLASNNEVYTYSKLNSYAWRKALWAAAVAWLSPLGYVIGEGTGAFFSKSLDFFPLAYGTHWNAHNVYIQLLVDMGVLGVAAFAAIFIAAFRSVWIRTSIPKPIRIATLASIAAFAIECYSDNMIDYLVVNWNFWFLVGIVISSGTAPAGPVRRNVR